VSVPFFPPIAKEGLIETGAGIDGLRVLGLILGHRDSIRFSLQ